MLYRKLSLSLLLVCASHAYGETLSERDYYTELPEILTVTRMAQPLNETPGAVTVIDRQTIRRSGARQVADLLRLVPGYLVGGTNGSHPSPAYHAPLDDFGSRNLVFVDGRPVYNSYYLGETYRGLMGVLVEDIERIEVLRGSNSAAYGANAMFGVINIMTRHAADTHGAEVSMTNGDIGIRDGMARVGWGNEQAHFRLSAGERKDDGWKGAFDGQRVGQFHFRGDFRPAADQEWLVTAGSLDMSLEDGQGTDGSPFRGTAWNENFVNLQWRKQLDSSEEIKLSASYDSATNRDRAVYVPDPTVTLDFGGKSRKFNIEFQHQFGLSPQLRMVWGVGYERNEAESPPLLYTRDTVEAHESRMFGNVEWRPHPQWLINAGGFWQRHSWTGDDFSPRLMANFHVTPDHTLRAGVSRAVRTPNLFELAADVRYYPTDFARLMAARRYPPAFAARYNMPYRLFYSDGQLEAEKLQVREVGYFGNFHAIRMTLDVRGYVERTEKLIEDTVVTIPGYVYPPNIFGLPAGASIPVGGFANQPGFKTQGLEYQLRWKPFQETEIWLNQNFQQWRWDADATYRDISLPPTHATTLALFQKLPHELDLSVMFQTMKAMTWGGQSDVLPPRRRLDIRLAFPFRIGTTRAEWAWVTQAANGNSPEYLLRRRYEFERRTFGTLRLEF